MKPEIRVAAEVLAIMNIIDKGKSIQNSLLDAAYILVNNKINENFSSLLRGLGIMLTNK